MVYATSDGSAGKRLRVGMVGGGRNAFIGAVHRMAMRLDDLIELKAGALSSDAENARASGADLGLAADRSYSDYREMAARESARSDGIEAAVIVTRTTFTFPSPKRSSRQVSTSSATSLSRRRLPKPRSWSSSLARKGSFSRWPLTIPAIRWFARRGK